MFSCILYLSTSTCRVRLYRISAVSYFPTSYTHSSLFILFFLSPLFCLGACCCLASGVWTQPNPLSYYPPHDLSYNGGGSTSSIQSLWICGEDCHISKVSWLDFPALSLFHHAHVHLVYIFWFPYRLHVNGKVDLAIDMSFIYINAGSLGCTLFQKVSRNNSFNSYQHSINYKF